MPPAKTKPEIPNRLDEGKVKEFPEPLQVKVYREREQGGASEHIPLLNDGQGWTFDQVRSLEQSMPSHTGGGTYVATVLAENGSAFTWRFWVPGAAIIPPSVRMATAQADMQSRDAAAIAHSQLGGQPVMQPFSPIAPPISVGPAQPIGPQASPAQAQQVYIPGIGFVPVLSPPQQNTALPTPYGGYPMPMPYYSQPTAPPPSSSTDAELRALRSMVEAKDREIERERQERKMEELRREQREAREAQDRQWQGYMEAQRRREEENERRHRELIASLTGKPTIDPADTERRLKDDFERRESDRRREEESRRREDALRQEMRDINERFQREQQKLQDQLALAQREHNASAQQLAMDRIADMQRQSSEQTRDLINRFIESKPDLLAELTKLKTLMGGDSKWDVLAMDVMRDRLNGSGGGPTTAEVVGGTIDKAIDGVKETIQVLAEAGSKTELAKTQAMASASGRLRNIQERQRSEAKDGQLRGSEPTPIRAVNGKNPPNPETEDPAYFGPAWGYVVSLRKAVASNSANGTAVLNWLMNAYMQARMVGADFPALADLESNAQRLIDRLLPEAPEGFRKELAAALPEHLALLKQQVGQAGNEGEEDEDEEGDGNDKPAA